MRKEGAREIANVEVYYFLILPSSHAVVDVSAYYSNIRGIGG
jgi:hypothetical protein